MPDSKRSIHGRSVCGNENLLQLKVYKNDRSVKSKYVEWGLSKDNPRTIIVISSLDNKDLVRNTLLNLVEEREGTKCNP